MTAFDIYSAVGNVGEDVLEESEAAPKKNIFKIMPVLAAAACFAVLAVGLNRTLRNDGIEEYSPEAYPTVGSDEAAAELETGAIVTESGDVVYYTSAQSLQTAPVFPGETTTYYVPGQTSSEYMGGAETVEMFTEPYPYDDSTLQTAAETESIDPATTVAASDAEPDDEAETALVPKWDDMSDMERYIYLEYNGNEYSITMNKFDKSELTFLQNGRLYGFDEEHDEDCVGPVRRDKRCAFYKIKNVNENYMIAALTADGNYTAFRNSRYRPDTLGSYLEDIDFSNRCKLTTIRSKTYIPIGNELQTQYFEYHLPGLQQAVEKLLAENSGAVPEINPPPVSDIYLIICGDDTFPTVRISEGGYVGVLGKYFKIGEDKTESFMAYIEENAVKTEYDPRAGADTNEPMILE